MSVIIWIVLVFVFNIVLRKMILKKFELSSRVIYYQVSVVFNLLITLALVILLRVSDATVFNNSGIGNLLAIISIIYFLVTHRRIYLDRNGKYQLLRIKGF